ncbi:hypothetical protein [Microbispora rosea]
MSGMVVLEAKWPVLGRHARAAEWLQIWVDLGRVPRTIDAYARGLAEYLEVCEREGIDPVTASRAHIGLFVRELTERPNRRGANVVALDSGSGLSNATIQQRIVPVRLFYDHLMEEGLRNSNPVGRQEGDPSRFVFTRSLSAPIPRPTSETFEQTVTDPRLRGAGSSQAGMHMDAAVLSVYTHREFSRLLPSLARL